MNDIPYVDWLDGIEAYMERRNIQCHRVLELGCGTGRFTALLAADGYEVTGLDLSEAMIKVAKKSLSEKEFLTSVRTCEILTLEKNLML